MASLGSCRVVRVRWWCTCKNVRMFSKRALEASDVVCFGWALCGLIQENCKNRIMESLF